MVEISVDVALEVGAVIGESPVWDDRSETLIWVDCLGEKLHRFDPATGFDVEVDAKLPVGSAALRNDGGIVLTLVDGFAFCNSDGSGLVRVGAIRTDTKKVRFNDGKVDPKGRFIAGTMRQSGTEPCGSLFQMSPDFSVIELLSDVMISNGLTWSHDGRTLYYIDSRYGGVDAFDVHPETGELSGKRRVISIPASDGSPDGMTIDDTGCLWIALYRGGGVRRYTSDGKLEAVIQFPVSNVTCPTFGGSDLGDLYVTSARRGIEPSALKLQPHAGDLFVCRPGVFGLNTFRFGSV